MKLDIPEILKSLAKNRPVFHSEADFQHSLAWQIREMHPGLHPRLEYPFERPTGKACDIVLLRNGKMVMAIELKYFGENISCEINGEIFNLKNRSAHNDNSYRSFEDVKRMEEFLKNNPSAIAVVIVLTNNHIYWSGPRDETVNYAPFTLKDGRSVSGHIDWVNKTLSKKDMPAIYLHGNYTLKWEEYSKVAGRFRYLHIPVQPPKN